MSNDSSPLVDASRGTINIMGLEVEVPIDLRSARSPQEAITTAILRSMQNFEMRLQDLEVVTAHQWPHPDDETALVKVPESLAGPLRRLHGRMQAIEQMRAMLEGKMQGN